LTWSGTACDYSYGFKLHSTQCAKAVNCRSALLNFQTIGHIMLHSCTEFRCKLNLTYYCTEVFLLLSLSLLLWLLWCWWTARRFPGVKVIYVTTEDRHFYDILYVTYYFFHRVKTWLSTVHSWSIKERLWGSQLACGPIMLHFSSLTTSLSIVRR
jgi:hypothetical protein